MDKFIKKRNANWYEAKFDEFKFKFKSGFGLTNHLLRKL